MCKVSKEKGHILGTSKTMSLGRAISARAGSILAVGAQQGFDGQGQGWAGCIVGGTIQL